MSMVSSPRSLRDLSIIKHRSLTTLGILFALIWLLITFLQEDPMLFIFLGGFNLFITIISRIQARRHETLELEGKIIGFLIIWVLAFFFYGKKQENIVILNWIFQIEELMVSFLIISFLTWFIITPKKTTQEIIFRLPPFYSNLVLNLWKLAVIFLFLVTFPALRFLSNYAILFFLICGFFELIIFYKRQYNINYINIILNPIRLLFSVFAGPLEASKWIFLTIIFILLDQMDLDIGTLLLMFSAIFVGLITLITMLTKLFLSSGVVESRVKENKTLIPQVIEEIQQMYTLEKITQFNEFYEVPKEIKIHREKEIISFNSGDLLFRLPFNPALEEKTGIFIFHLNKQKLLINIEKERRWRRWTDDLEKRKEMKKEVKNLNLSGSSFHRISPKRWEILQKELRPIEKDIFATSIGFEDSQELDIELVKVVQGSVAVQEQIRSRLRGVPAPRFKRTRRVDYKTTLIDKSITLPNDLLEMKRIRDNQEIEIIPGKDEYLFYARIKRSEEEKRDKKEIASKILITGAAKGLGFSLTQILLEKGHTVFAIDKAFFEDLDELKEKYRNKLVIYEVDVTKENEVQRTTDQIGKITRSIDILINNAGIYLERERPDIEQIDFEKISRTLETNAIGPLKMTKHFLPLLRNSKTFKLIVNISSEAGSISNQSRDSEFGYCMAKAALNMQSKILDNRLKKEGIKVITLAPGWFSSDMGGPEAPITPLEAAENVVNTIFLDWNIDDPIFIDTDSLPMNW
ncbi:MAG: SDR family oxidoreductase [Candidatus Hodarchaeota archaeon]